MCHVYIYTYNTCTYIYIYLYTYFYTHVSLRAMHVFFWGVGGERGVLNYPVRVYGCYMGISSRLP